MGMIIGLDRDDIIDLIKRFNEIWVSNQNNPLTFIISGKYDEVVQLLSMAKEEGALKADLLPVTNPYHSELLRKAAQGFARTVQSLPFSDPVYPYVSNIDRKLITSRRIIQQEVIGNLYQGMNWYETMRSLISFGSEIFFECGAGDGLTRNFRFIDPSVKAFSVDKLEQFLALFR